MEPIIDPIPVQLIEQELTPERLLRHTNKADNDIYVVTAHNAPNTMSSWIIMSTISEIVIRLLSYTLHRINCISA